jgi:hypothetical protein
MLVHYPFFEWNYCVICNCDTFWAHVRAALRDVAVAYAMVVSKVFQSALVIERVHLERRAINEQAGPNEMVVQRVLAQDMADILAEKTFDALPKLLHSIDVLLRHSPCSVGRVR